MKQILIAVGIFVACQAFLLDKKHECSTDADCPNTHCCVNDSLEGQYCFHYQNETQPCHLSGHTMHLYKCGCSSGYHCEVLHLNPDHSILDPNGAIHHAEELLSQSGYGVCVKNT